MNGQLAWAEIKPILGPLIQAGVVLMVGAWTIWYQLRQARTAERKLFADLHDKRYTALSGFTNEIVEMVRTILDQDDDRPPNHINVEQARSRGHAAQMEELTWLFGSDVIFHLTQMHERAEEIMGTINRLRHNLDSDDKVRLVESLNRNNEAMYGALGRVNEAARHYLYVGHIKTQAPAMPAFTLDQLKAHEHPGRIR